MTILLAIGLLAILTLLVVGIVQIVRVREQLNVISIQLSERRGWKGEKP
jgi:hypothetical protein